VTFKISQASSSRAAPRAVGVDLSRPATKIWTGNAVRHKPSTAERYDRATADSHSVLVSREQIAGDRPGVVSRPSLKQAVVAQGSPFRSAGLARERVTV
jgi:hypothetical protein